MRDLISDRIIRRIRRAFLALGYSVSNASYDIPENSVKDFQSDYNNCADNLKGWDKIAVNGKLDKETLIALDSAVKLAEYKSGRSLDEIEGSWKYLCKKHEKPNEDLRYVEVMPNGSANVRDLQSDLSLRANLIAFDREGDVIFAIVSIPAQADLPAGQEERLRCPCVVRR